MSVANVIVSKQLKEKCMCHKQLISRLENEREYQQLTTNKINQILYQPGELLSACLLQITNEKRDGTNAPKHKIIPADYNQINH